MAYQVLARKWRPQNFTDCVGQEHVIQLLANSLQNQRLHHAYLLTGTRGVGKTSIARILAKAMNCENLQEANPCEYCPVCLDFNQGRFMDLIEVDAASRTKVEDMRDLLDNAQYAPNQGRYKIYLIDEVHMLSNHSFNALLKTLEEPPPHVKFLLATTHPQKIPVTVLSRCLQLNLKQLLPEEIEKQMKFILSQETISFDASALTLIARAAEGSLRDGLSLLDQAIAFGQGRVTQLNVSTMLGTVEQQPVNELLHALVSGQGEAILEKIASITTLNADFSDVLQQLLQTLHRVALLQAVPNFNDPAIDQIMLTELATLIQPEDVQLYYQIALIGQKDLDLAPNPRMGFEMLMLRMLHFKPVSLSQPLPVVKQVVEHQISAPIDTTQIIQPSEKTMLNEDNLEWINLIRAMNLKGMTKQLADNCILIHLDEQHVALEIDPDYKMIDPNYKEKLKISLQDYHQKPLQLLINPKKQDHRINTPARQYQQVRIDLQQAAVDSINNDANIQALKEQLDARILPGTIVPIDS